MSVQGGYISPQNICGHLDLRYKSNTRVLGKHFNFISHIFTDFPAKHYRLKNIYLTLKYEKRQMKHIIRKRDTVVTYFGWKISNKIINRRFYYVQKVSGSSHDALVEEEQLVLVSLGGWSYRSVTEICHTRKLDFFLLEFVLRPEDELHEVVKARGCRLLKLNLQYRRIQLTCYL